MFKKLKNKPVVIAIILALIIGIVCGIIYFTEFYQPELEFPPELIVVNADGTETKFLLKSYNWTYKGENKTFDLGIEDITKYNFEAENTNFQKALDNFYGGSMTKVKLSPNYKSDGFVCSSYNYTGYNINPEYHHDSRMIEPDEEINLAGPTLGTKYYQIDLKSNKQGMASYILKDIDSTFFDLEYIKNNELNSVENITKFLKDNYMSDYLSNVEIAGDKVKITYRYYANENFSSDVALVIFAKMDNINTVEFEFLHDKYKRSVIIDGIPDAAYVDKIEPKIYNREGFETFTKNKIEELKAHIEK